MDISWAFHRHFMGISWNKSFIKCGQECHDDEDDELKLFQNAQKRLAKMTLARTTNFENEMIDKCLVMMLARVSIKYASSYLA
jgi:hypothetical protein